VAVVVTDGHSQDNPAPAGRCSTSSRNQLKKVFYRFSIAGVTILTLGIGDHINRDEIVRISGNDELAFQVWMGAEIICGPDFVQVGISTTKKLKGRLFFEGFHQEPGCSSVEDNSNKNQDDSRFDVRTIAPHGKCGLIITFDRRFATANDHSFEIRCFYPDKTKTAKNPKRAQGVTTLVTEAVLSGSKEPSLELTQAMKCRYVVTPHPDQCSSSAITVGTPLVHTWSCDQDHPRFLVHSCFIADPVSHRIEMLIDHHG
ncbi:hypothetical protein OSTOST_21648, partial [Ostertagia ostertagi]